MNNTVDGWTKDMIKAGVDEKHIKAMQNRKLISDSEFHNYYDRIGKRDSAELVDTSKIKGINTGWETEGRSVYELFFSVIINKNICYEPLHFSRIKTNLDSLIKNEIDKQFQFYINKSVEKQLRDGLPKFVYFQEDDAYFSNATHRTVSALMFGAPYMIGYVTVYKKNYMKYENYIRYKQAEQNFIKSIRDLREIKIEKCEISIWNNNDTDLLKLALNDELGVEIMRFLNPVISDYDLKFEDEEGIMEKIEHINKVSSKLTSIESKLECVSRKELFIKILLQLALFSKSKALWYLVNGYIEKECRSISIEMNVNDIVKGIQKARALDKFKRSGAK